ncbi:hypothetical protein FH972_005828 [Carpinus fangiana]|uniref:Uncharacterized protein n=1 Tax=Carpinus fangiana TaxID=176857 RepID=A0A5N6QSW4_9ROSI|nr:hypothetical protein FH972_005828 [Carpinus fangiana]
MESRSGPFSTAFVAPPLSCSTAPPPEDTVSRPPSTRGTCKVTILLLPSNFYSQSCASISGQEDKREEEEIG